MSNKGICSNANLIFEPNVWKHLRPNITKSIFLFIEIIWKHSHTKQHEAHLQSRGFQPWHGSQSFMNHLVNFSSCALCTVSCPLDECAYKYGIFLCLPFLFCFISSTHHHCWNNENVNIKGLIKVIECNTEYTSTRTKTVKCVVFPFHCIPPRFLIFTVLHFYHTQIVTLITNARLIFVLEWPMTCLMYNILKACDGNTLAELIMLCKID